MIKRWDILITILLISVSLLPLVIFTHVQAGKVNEHSILVAVISVEHEVVERITLTDNTGVDIFDLTPSAHDRNTIEVRDDRIRMKSATCSDQVCVNFGFISKSGETIVCLPHKILIEIQTIDGNTDDLIISS
jgi:hypothetical protein